MLNGVMLLWFTLTALSVAFSGVAICATHRMRSGLARPASAIFLLALLVAASASAARAGAPGGQSMSSAVVMTAGDAVELTQSECATNRHASAQQNCFGCIGAPVALPPSAILEAASGLLAVVPSRQRKLVDRIESPALKPPISLASL